VVAVGNAVHERLAAGGGEDSKTPAVIDRTIEFVDDADGPVFSFVNLMDAHLPYHPPDEYAAEFAPGVDSTAVCQNSKAYNCGATDVDDEEWGAIRGLYDAEIRHMDHQLGRLFDSLRSEGRYGETMIVVCADHGELHGEHGLYGHEFNVYDPLVNVPLIVKHPEIEPGRRTETVELLDLYHTVLDATGVEGAGVPLDPARSMLSPAYREGDDGDYGFVEYHRPVVELNQLESIAAGAGIELDEASRFYSRMRAVRRPDAKYIRNERIADEAYRLDSDAGETADRHGEDDPVVEELAAALVGFEERVGGAWTEGEADDPLSGMDDTTMDRLRELGYVE
jgi:arylsulfatase A-like enzyme